MVQQPSQAPVFATILAHLRAEAHRRDSVLFALIGALLLRLFTRLEAIFELWKAGAFPQPAPRRPRPRKSSVRTTRRGASRRRSPKCVLCAAQRRRAHTYANTPARALRGIIPKPTHHTRATAPPTRKSDPFSRRPRMPFSLRSRN